MTTHVMAAWALMLVLLGAVGGWCAGWAARGEQNRLYEHSREAYLAQQARWELAAADVHRADAHWTDAHRVAPPAVVHVHLEVPPPSLEWPVCGPVSIGGPDD